MRPLSDEETVIEHTLRFVSIVGLLCASVALCFTSSEAPAWDSSRCDVLMYLECAVKRSASSELTELTALVAASLDRNTHRKCPVAFAVSAGRSPNEAA